MKHSNRGSTCEPTTQSNKILQMLLSFLCDTPPPIQCTLPSATATDLNWVFIISLLSFIILPYGCISQNNMLCDLLHMYKKASTKIFIETWLVLVKNLEQPNIY